MSVQFINNLSSTATSTEPTQPHAHSHESGSLHSHDHGINEHGHTHEHLDSAGEIFSYTDSSDYIITFHAGKYSERDLPDYSGRNFEERGFTIGIGGYVLSYSSRGFLILNRNTGLLAPARLH
jgi:urease accessory protein